MAAQQLVCFGELLIDFVALERGVPVGHARRFEKAAGGAPANVAVGLARLGQPAAFITQLGDDPFGHFLAEIVAENGVDTRGVVFTTAANTALAFAAVEASGERSFAFYRNPSADMLMTPEALDRDLLAQARVLHYGSITLIDDPVRETTLTAIRLAWEGGALVSYDPNLRSALWPSLAAARDGILAGLAKAALVKMSLEELAFLHRRDNLQAEADIVQAARALWHDRLQLMVITRGADGCLAVRPDAHWHSPGFSVTVEDTIGAGDGFMAGLLSEVVKQAGATGWPDWDTPDVVPGILQRANAVGALTTTRRGAIPALPDAAAVDAFLAANGVAS